MYRIAFSLMQPKTKSGKNTHIHTQRLSSEDTARIENGVPKGWKTQQKQGARHNSHCIHAGVNLAFKFFTEYVYLLFWVTHRRA